MEIIIFISGGICQTQISLIIQLSLTAVVFRSEFRLMVNLSKWTQSETVLLLLTQTVMYIHGETDPIGIWVMAALTIQMCIIRRKLKDFLK